MRRSAQPLFRALPAVVLAIAASCGSSPAPPVTAQEPALPVDADRKFDDAARYLAGLPARDGSIFFAAETDPAWLRHRGAMDELWSHTGRHRLPGYERFQKAELDGSPFSSGVLFYPFGGPDALTATLLFPRKEGYVLVGLEPPGALPREELLAPEEREKWLNGIRYALRSVVRSSFFITSQMRNDLRGRAADGVLPLLLVELVRTGHRIQGVAQVAIGEDGKASLRKSETDGIAGVLVEFSSENENKTRRLTYFSADLSSPKFDGNKALRAYLESLGTVTTFLKAASYLPHRQGFSGIRDHILSRSTAIVQDDTGIPFRFFDDAWQVRLYGGYDRPIPSFARMVQPDLREAYGRSERKPLGFHIGYGSGRKPSNLLVATRLPTQGG
ncbi:MAG: hypothetical protein R2729_23010 [Bryobacteraceae bacterium]